MPRYVKVLVEGQSEENFIRTVLSPYLESYNTFITPIIIITRQNIRGRDNRGGISNYRQVRNHLMRLLGNQQTDIVTTMIDYYALPDDFPGYRNLPPTSGVERIHFLEQQFANDIGNNSFRPYLQMHEFEALVFAAHENFHFAFPDQPNKIRQIRSIVDQFTSPEEIDNDFRTAPSKRLKRIFTTYQKIVHSGLILSGVSVDTLRSRCPHFNKWLMKIMQQ